MSKIYNIYEDKIDRTWYKSSNIKYSECDDNVDSLKTVRVYFNDGRTYQYEDVNVNDYLCFREDISQGKALNKILKKYTCSKLENSDITEINENLERLVSNIDYELSVDDDVLKIYNKDEELLHEESFESIKNNIIESISTILSKTNVKFKFK